MPDAVKSKVGFVLASLQLVDEVAGELAMTPAVSGSRVCFANSVDRRGPPGSALPDLGGVGLRYCALGAARSSSRAARSGSIRPITTWVASSSIVFVTR